MAKFPPLNPLHAFEAAARLESFTLAAQELGVSQSAISRHIGVLEAYLKVKLFRREHQGAYLTDIGRIYSNAVTPAFTQIRLATRNVISITESEPIKIRAYSTFAVKWLFPRVSEFESEYPNLDIRLVAGIRQVNFAAEDLDLAILFGDGNWSNTTCDQLIPDKIEPVCSPALLKGGRFQNLEDLKKQRTLYSRYRQDDWLDWIGAIFGNVNTLPNEMEFPNSILAYQAACDGLGIAMGQLHLLTQELERGILIRPFNRPLERKLGFYLVRPEQQLLTPKVRAFRAWILKSTSMYRPPLSPGGTA